MEQKELMKSDTFEKLVIYLIPGFICVFPWWLYLILGSSQILLLIKSYETLFGTLVISSAIASGMLLEDLGCRIELWFDWCQKDRDENRKIWKRYLKIQWDKEPVGHRYLRSMLRRMKFELSFALSLLSLLIGLLKVNKNHAMVSPVVMTNFFWVTVILIGYLLFEAWKGSGALSDIRRLIVPDEVVSRGEPDQAVSPTTEAP